MKRKWNQALNARVRERGESISNVNIKFITARLFSDLKNSISFYFIIIIISFFSNLLQKHVPFCTSYYICGCFCFTELIPIRENQTL